ncbi:MAG: D-aminoacylase [Promethearchaeota archaeon]|nr:MAG: D-aminoacylase [Candidatus Lokiarchaeota archaeon]
MNNFLIKDGKVIDGTGNPWFKADIRISGEKITEIALEIKAQDNEEIIDASGHVVAPGFIDIHTHSDFTVLLSRCENVLSQGVTTHVVGNCGFSLIPMNPEIKNDDAFETFLKMLGISDFDFKFVNLNDYLNELKRNGISINIIPMIGHSTLRMNVLRLKSRAPKENEMMEMKRLLEREMSNGAFGMSTGLDYPPGSFAKTKEIIELCRVVNEYNGIYTTHFRGFASGLTKATKEAIEIAESGIPVEINHFKPFGFWRGSIKRAYKLVEKARENNLDVTFDVFPHASNHTFLFALLPPWIYLSKKKLDIPKGIQLLKDSRTNQDLKQKIYDGIDVIVRSFLQIEELEDWKKVYINAPKSEQFNGKTVYQNSIEKEMDPRQVLIEVLIEQDGNVGGTYKSITKEENLITITHPLTMFASDGRVIPEENDTYFPNPYCNGTFTRVLGKNVREEKLLTLHDAIRRMTSYPAQRLGLKDRGMLREGFWADITIFNPKTVIDKATYENPRLLSEGVEHVFVNGISAVKKGIFTGAMAGMPIRKQ